MLSAGRLAAYATHRPLAVATRCRRATRTPACIRAPSRAASASGNSSASHATAATNSTHTPMNTKHRSTSSISIDVGEAREKRGERVDQDAVGQHAPAAEPVGEIAAEQPEDAAGERRNVEQPADPHLKLRRSGRGARQLQQRGPHDERQHQDFVDVEREADGGDGADQPLHRRQPSAESLSCVMS